MKTVRAINKLVSAVADKGRNANMKNEWLEHNPNINNALMNWIQNNESSVRALASGKTSPEEKKRIVEKMKQVTSDHI